MKAINTIVKTVFMLMAVSASSQAQSVQFACQGAADLSGTIELGQYIRMGHYNINGGKVVLALKEADGQVSKLNLAINPNGATYQEGQAAWFSGVYPQQTASLEFQLNFYGQSLVIYKQYNESKQFPTTCELVGSQE